MVEGTKNVTALRPSWYHSLRKSGLASIAAGDPWPLMGHIVEQQVACWKDLNPVSCDICLDVSGTSFGSFVGEEEGGGGARSGGHRQRRRGNRYAPESGVNLIRRWGPKRNPFGEEVSLQDLTFDEVQTGTDQVPWTEGGGGGSRPIAP